MLSVFPLTCSIGQHDNTRLCLLSFQTQIFQPLHQATTYNSLRHTFNSLSAFQFNFQLYNTQTLNRNLQQELISQYNELSYFMDTTKVGHPAPTMGIYYTPPEPVKPDSFPTAPSVATQRTAEPPTPHSVCKLPSISTLLARTPSVSPQLSRSVMAAPSDFSQTAEKDPELYPYPREQNRRTGPLFNGPAEVVASRRRPSPPTLDEQRLVSVCIEKMRRDPQAWARREMGYLQSMGPQFPQAASTHATRPLQRSAPGSSPVAKRQKVTKTASVPKLTRIPRRHASPSPKYDSFEFDKAPQTPKQKVVKPAAPRDNTSYEFIPNYCPPLSTLPPKAAFFKKGESKVNPLPLDSDPHRHELHPLELEFASAWRLTCNVYLANKRRIFQSRLNYYREGKKFNKTAAQQACKIDVNKASKMYEAFERVGWFDDRLIAPYALSGHSD